MVWSFEIVPVGGHQRLAAGTDIEAAQQHAQTVNETRTPGFSTYKGRVPARDGLAAGGKRIRTLGPRYVDDAFETILVAWLAFAFLPERPTRSRGGTAGSKPLSSTRESARTTSGTDAVSACCRVVRRNYREKGSCWDVTCIVFTRPTGVGR
jgi:hypothetical protein